MSSFQVGTILADRYRLTGRIAGGGMGEVWRGVDLVLDRPVAVKLMHAGYTEHSETLARFRAEARHAAAVSHPAIAQVYDYGDARPGQPPFLVMELVDGPPLTGLLAAGALGPVQTADVIAQVAAGLAAAHAAGLVHRDIKPGNLLVGSDGTVKITDFGIAHAAGSAPLTRTGAVIGTPAYLAPERLAGASAKPASDLYSLGIVAHECLTGQPPFTGTAVEIALAHRHRELPGLPPAVPGELAGLVAELTARDPAQRPGSADQVAARARQLRESMSGTYPAPGARLGSPLPFGVGHAADRGMGTGLAASSLTVAGLGDHTLDDLPLLAPGDDARMRAWPRFNRDTLRQTSVWRVAAPVIAAIAVIAGVAGWMAAGGNTVAQPRNTGAGTRAAAAAAGRRVEVDSAALVGQPVGVVLRRLHQLGLRVRLTWVPSSHQVPGTVVSVRPGGKVAVGTTIAVIGAARHRGERHGHGGDGNGGGNGGGGNDGGGNGGGNGGNGD